MPLTESRTTLYRRGGDAEYVNMTEDAFDVEGVCLSITSRRR